MTFEKYTEIRFQTKSLEVIDAANAIIDDLQAKGLTLTLRQLYYQFVARELLENKKSSYSRLGIIIKNARMAGLVSWTALEDRTRVLQGAVWCSSPEEAIADAAEKYRIDKWAGSPVRIEVWIEKDALIGVIERVCVKHDVDYFAGKGYVSTSWAWGSGKRFQGYRDGGARVVILHLGDHDPAGVDMSRDNQARLNLFTGGGVEVKRIALTMDQIEEYKLPPNLTKMSDTRAEKYVAEHGDLSCELDSLDPETLQNILEGHILEYRDPDIWKRNVALEEEHRAVMNRLAEDAELGE